MKDCSLGCVPNLALTHALELWKSTNKIGHVLLKNLFWKLALATTDRIWTKEKKHPVAYAARLLGGPAPLEDHLPAAEEESV